MMRVGLLGVGLYAPGLPSWAAAAPVLRGESDWRPEPAPAVSLPLPSAERRRTSASARAAWAAAEQALAGVAIDRREVKTVFVSSGGDGVILHQLCTALAAAGRAVSPTQFHNSVHNAPAGYYGIANASQAASLSLCSRRAPFAAGLLEAAVQATVENSPVLLVGFDLVAPFPLCGFWPAQQDFSVALLLSPDRRAHALAQWDIAPAMGEATADINVADINAADIGAADIGAADIDAADWMGQFARANPMAACLPLLADLASGAGGRHRLPYLEDRALEVGYVN
jgi:hypothetical protein